MPRSKPFRCDAGFVRMEPRSKGPWRGHRRNGSPPCVSVAFAHILAPGPASRSSDGARRAARERGLTREIVTGFDRFGIAARLRVLLAKSMEAGLPAVAKTLAVAEHSLRISVDEASPYPSIDVLVAVTRQYGVDPGWLVTGEYDAATHLLATTAAEEGHPSAIHQLIMRLTTQQRPDWSAPLATPPDRPERAP